MDLNGKDAVSGMHVRCRCGASLHLFRKIATGINPLFFLEEAVTSNAALFDEIRRVHIFQPKG